MSEPSFERCCCLSEGGGHSLNVFLSVDLALCAVCERSHHPCPPPPPLTASLTVIIRRLPWWGPRTAVRRVNLRTVLLLSNFTSCFGHWIKMVTLVPSRR